MTKKGQQNNRDQYNFAKKKNTKKSKLRLFFLPILGGEKIK